MRHFLLLAVVISFLSLQFGCAPNPSANSTTGSRTLVTDSDLKRTIESKLNSDTELRTANLRVGADAQRNMATLSGTVTSERLRDKAVALAKSAHPGLTIENKIDVKPHEMTRTEYTEELARQERQRAKEWKDNIGASLDDAWIHAKVVSKLIADTKTPEHRINVDVNDNVVSLRGTVDTVAQKNEAERLARETDGVKGVVNQLKVAKS